MNKYEIMYILDKDLTDEDRVKLIDRFTQIVESMGGSIVNLDKWGMKKFAYEINHKNEGYYFLMYIQASAQVPQEIERLVGITEGVVRCMIIKRDEFNFKKPKRAKIEETKNVEGEVAADSVEPKEAKEIEEAAQPEQTAKAEETIKVEDNAKAEETTKTEDVKVAKPESASDKPNKSEEKAVTKPIMDADVEYGSPVIDGVSAEFGQTTDDLENTADMRKE